MSSDYSRSPVVMWLKPFSSCCNPLWGFMTLSVHVYPFSFNDVKCTWKVFCWLTACTVVLLRHQKGVRAPERQRVIQRESRSTSTQHAPGHSVALWNGWMEEHCLEIMGHSLDSGVSSVTLLVQISVLLFLSFIHSLIFTQPLIH